MELWHSVYFLSEKGISGSGMIHSVSGNFCSTYSLPAIRYNREKDPVLKENRKVAGLTFCPSVSSYTKSACKIHSVWEQECLIDGGVWLCFNSSLWKKRRISTPEKQLSESSCWIMAFCPGTRSVKADVPDQLICFVLVTGENRYCLQRHFMAWNGLPH